MTNAQPQLRKGRRAAAPDKAITAAAKSALRGKKPPMRDEPDFNRHNAQSNSVAADELRQFIERFEQLEAEKKDVSQTQKAVMSEAKGRGYDTKILRKIVALRKRTHHDIAEEESILELYKQALGMA